MGKIVVITGASRGIGYALTSAFLAQGHHVVALSRNTKPLEKFAGKSCHALSLDLTQEAAFPELFAFLKKEYGRVDILIHNAGLLINKPFESLNSAEIEQIYRVNVFGPMALTRVLLPLMDHTAHVVSISSMGGVNGTAKFPGLSAYSSSKGALIIWSEVMAEEYKDRGPKFNTLAIGAVQTEMLAEAFPGYEAPLTPEEMAAYILEFALNGHRIFNGKTLPASQSTP
ncbi:SDR family oxidoreductase [Flavobacteriaceae bacterium]|nr:SDR family oxidoreductase [Flavobacteriaceae bacterium]